MLEQFAVAHLSLPAKTVSAVFSRMAEAVTETRAMIPGYITLHPEFREIGERMMAVWNDGVNGLTG
jgi:serine/threonine-protein kinase HipA